MPSYIAQTALSAVSGQSLRAARRMSRAGSFRDSRENTKVVYSKGFTTILVSGEVALLRPETAPNNRQEVGRQRRLWLAAFFSAFLAVSGFSGAAEPADEAFSRLYFGLQPPTNRDVERAVELVEELLERGRFGEAAPLIDDQLAAPTDHLDSRGASLKARLVRAVEATGPAGSAALQAVLRGAYRRRLDEATTTADLRKLIAAHPPEVFGSEALVRLAETEADHGAFSAATGAYQLALELAEQAEQEGLAERLAGRVAANRLRRSADAVHDVAESFRPLSEPTFAVAQQSAGLRAPTNWLGTGGDARRQVVIPGDEPKAWRTWRVGLPATSEPDEDKETFHSNASIAIDGLLVTRVDGGLLAVQTDTGKRVWGVELAGGVDPDRPSDRHRGLGIASDSRLVFAVTVSGRADSRRSRANYGGRRLAAVPNALAAYELASGGKLRWRIDAARPAGPIAGARFLGPPAASEDRLYTLVEIEQSICLVQIDSGTGATEWVQPIMRSQREAPADPAAAGVTPTIGDRFVYCLTGRGAVVAVDPLLRRIAWVHYLRVEKDKARPARQNGWRGFRGRAMLDDLDAWRHGRVVESQGRLVVVSPVSQSLQVLDAATGEQLWRRKRPGGWLLAAVLEDEVLTIDADRVRSHALSDGRPRWTAPLPPGDSPAGEGLLLEDRYLLPLRSGNLATISVAAGEDKDRVSLQRLGLNPLDQPVSLGDLLSHRGSIYSRSADSIERFDQIGVAASALEEVDRRLAAGDALGALDLLRTLPDRDDRRLAEREAVALLSVARSDPEAEALAAEKVPQLVAGPRAAAEGAVLRVRVALAEGDTETAADSLADLASGPAAGVVLTPESGWRVEATRLAWQAFGTASASDQQALRLAVARLASPAQRQAAAARLAGMLSTQSDQPPGDFFEEPRPFSDAWSLRQIAATVETEVEIAAPKPRSTRRSRQSAIAPRQRLRLSDGAGGPVIESSWTIEPHGGGAMLVGSNAWGERLFVMNAQINLNARTSAGEPRVGVTGDRLGQGRLALRLEEGYAVYRIDDQGAADPLAWKSTRPATGDWRSQVNSYELSEDPVALGPWGAVSLANATIWCRDLETGERRWSREIDSLGPGPYRVFAHNEELHVAARGDRGARFSAWSGAQSPDPWSLPPAKTWRARAGGNLLVEGRSISGRELRLVPIDAPAETGEGDPLWRREFPPKVVLTTAGHGLLLALTPELELTAVDLRTGSERFQVRLAGSASAPCRAIRAEESNGRLLVEVDRSNPGVDRARGVRGVGQTPLLTGELHYLDSQAGSPLWAAPAQVAAMSRLRNSIQESPLILFARRQTPDSDEGEETIDLLAIDPRTGANVLHSEALPAGDDRRSPEVLEIRFERGSDECLQVRVSRAWVTLRPTDRPAPPAPPMTARVEDPFDNQPKNLGRGIDRLFKSLFDSE